MKDKHKEAILVACSARKTKYGRIAIEVYDGNIFRILRKYPTLNASIYILSAKHGIISAEESIESYDVLLSADLCSNIPQHWKTTFATILAKHEKIHVIMPKKYLEVISELMTNRHTQEEIKQLMIYKLRGIGSMQRATHKLCRRLALSDTQ